MATPRVHHASFFPHVFVSIVVIPLVCCPHFVNILTFHIPLSHSSVSRGRACICVVSSLLIVDYFGLCPVVVSLIDGFSTLNLVSSILYHCVFLWSFIRSLRHNNRA